MVAIDSIAYQMHMQFVKGYCSEMKNLKSENLKSEIGFNGGQRLIEEIRFKTDGYCGIIVE